MNYSMIQLDMFPAFASAMANQWGGYALSQEQNLALCG